MSAATPSASCTPAPERLLRQSGRELDVVIWGGVATPEAAAAFLATGARGIVFESLHWQTDLVETDDKLGKQLSKLRPEHTSIVGRSLGVCCRLFDKGNFPAVKALEDYARSLSDGPITADKRQAFAQRVAAAAVPALESDLDRRQLIPLGPEAAFAQTFRRALRRRECRGHARISGRGGQAFGERQGDGPAFSGEPGGPGVGHYLSLYPGGHDLDQRCARIRPGGGRGRRPAHRGPGSQEPPAVGD